MPLNAVFAFSTDSCKSIPQLACLGLLYASQPEMHLVPVAVGVTLDFPDENFIQQIEFLMRNLLIALAPFIFCNSSLWQVAAIQWIILNNIVCTSLFMPLTYQRRTGSPVVAICPPRCGRLWSDLSGLSCGDVVFWGSSFLLFHV